MGLVPAAGRATRLPGLATSKEVVPVPAGSPDGRPRPVVRNLLDGFARGGVREAIVLLRAGKWDVAAALAEESSGLAIAHVVVPGATPSIPATLDAAWPFVRGRAVALGFPDLLFSPADAFAPLVERLAGGAEVVLGLFPTTRTEKTDMVETAADGAVRAIHVKRRGVMLRYNWSIAVWSAAFGELLHEWTATHGAAPVAVADPAPGAPASREPYVSDALLAAIAAGWRIDTVAFPDGRYLDVGTPDDLLAAWREPWP